MIVVRAALALYFTLGIARAILCRSWQSAIDGVREGAKPGQNLFVAIAVAVPIGFVLDVVLWPVNQWEAWKAR